MVGDLESLRAEIDRVDEVLIEMISKRIEISRKIGDIKRTLGIPTRDPGREEEVVKRWISLSKEKGLPEDLAQSIVKLLIQYSIAAQSISRASGKKVAIIGYGGMARTLGKIISRAGYRVSISGRDLEKAENLAKELNCSYGEPGEVIPESDYVLLTLSREAFAEGYFDAITAFMRGKVVMDILSTKREIYRLIERESTRHGFKYISTHPLFGPLSIPYGETIVIIPSSTGLDVINEVVSFWSSMGLMPIITSYEEHEKAMAVVQVLPHIYMLALSEAIERLSKDFGIDYRIYMTYNFKKIQDAIDRVKNNIKVVLEIQEHNLHAPEARRIGLEAFLSTIKRFGGDR